MISALAALLIPAMTSPETLDHFVEKIPNSLVSFKMIKVPAGSIEIRGKLVELKAFAFGETEVTWDAYDIYAYRLDLSESENSKGVD
ncbi:MAG: hypothetical protein ABL962_15535, partial [Fimbriimonadaceae bacterium]